MSRFFVSYKRLNINYCNPQALDALTVNGLAPVSPKKKKSKKKKRDDESPTKSQGTVDLGALLKDSGIDFGDFGFDGLPSAASGLGSSTSSAAVSTPTVATVIAPVPEQVQQQPPVIELNDSGPSLNSSIGSTSSEPADLLPALPQLSFAPTPVQPQPTMQLVQMQDGSFRLEPNQGVVPPSSADSNPTSSPLSSAPLPNSNTSSSSSSSSQSVDQKKFPGRVPPRSRPVVDPNRTPLFEDDTLPHGWHRKVSQRKSGASAGRYEVFIIGPTHKRFRSRNELKSFFEKTGETTLNPDDFDFSTFGRNNTVGVSKVRIHVVRCFTPSLLAPYWFSIPHPAISPIHPHIAPRCFHLEIHPDAKVGNLHDYDVIYA